MSSPESPGDSLATRKVFLTDPPIAKTVVGRRFSSQRILPFARVGGHVIAIKGEQAPREIKESDRALRLLYAEIIGYERTTTGTLVTIEKADKTPKKYPRRPGEPKREPL